jgi:hypothetical protein
VDEFGVLVQCFATVTTLRMRLEFLGGTLSLVMLIIKLFGFRGRNSAGSGCVRPSDPSDIRLEKCFPCRRRYPKQVN